MTDIMSHEEFVGGEKTLKPQTSLLTLVSVILCPPSSHTNVSARLNKLMWHCYQTTCQSEILHYEALEWYQGYISIVFKL